MEVNRIYLKKKRRIAGFVSVCGHMLLYDGNNEKHKEHNHNTEDRHGTP